MNDLYQAVMILGRSVTEIDKYGWGFCTLGSKHSPKCVNGVLTIAAYDTIESGAAFQPQYVYQLTNARSELAVPLRMASIALIETAPQHIVEAISDTAIAELPTLSMDQLSNLLVDLNDADVQSPDEVDEYGDPVSYPLLTEQGARDWFNRAFDKLAKQLPEPIPADPPLTVQQIIEAAAVGRAREPFSITV